MFKSYLIFCGRSTDFFGFHAPDFGVAGHFCDGAGQNLVFSQASRSLELDIKVRAAKLHFVSHGLVFHVQTLDEKSRSVNGFLQIFFLFFSFFA